MKCKRCGFEWQSYGEALTCPGCGVVTALTQSEKQTLWEEAYEAEKIKDLALRARCYLALAEQGDEKAAYAYGECLRRGVGVAENAEEAIFYYRASARRLYPAAAYRLWVTLSESEQFGDSKKQAFFWLRVAAELGDADAAFALATAYEEGDTVAPSHRHALFWLTRAAKAGHGEARVLLAKSYFEGDGVEKNLAAARYFMKNVPVSGFRMKRFVRRLGAGECEEPAEIVLPAREEERLSLGTEAEASGEYTIASNLYFYAARGGSVEASYRLGLLYEEGKGVPKSLEEARRRYGIAARAGHTDALLRVARFLKEGVGGKADAQEAKKCYEHLEEKENAEGAFLLGLMYQEGKGLPVDIPAAIRHYKTALKLGFAEAEAVLERIKADADAVYERACVLEERGEMIAALDAYRTAAEMGHAGSAYTMGILVQQSATKPRERKEAFAYFRTAAEGGHLGGIYRLGLCYSRAYGVARNYPAANSLLAFAAKKNYEGASEELAVLKARKHRRAARRFYSISSVLYRKGDVMEAVKFRNIAAKLGSARAMYVLGCHLEFGDGLPADRVKAGAWYTRAAAAGFDPANGDLKGGFLRERKKLVLARRNAERK